ncbi:hypothetical protein [Glutamicibacter sp. NPDC087344]|uniref:hypothetical protein n=1 Tax=Glutamicibacter sp. NPDC087344 TaxID=3363994 RepID=UPI00380CA456
MTAQPVVEGSAARAVRPEPVSASDLQFVETPQRVTLSLVPRINEKNKRSVVVTSVALVMLFIGLIVALVLMNTSVAQRQYDIVSLRNQERALSQENQALLKDAQSLSAPQALAKKAAELGLVAPGAPGLIDLSEGKITQQAEEAVKSDENSTDYDTLPLPGESINGSTKSAKVEEKAKSSTPETTVGKQTTENASKESAAEAKTVKVERTVGDDGRPVFTEGELNGGTIPAPTMKSATD